MESYRVTIQMKPLQQFFYWHYLYLSIEIWNVILGTLGSKRVKGFFRLNIVHIKVPSVAACCLGSSAQRTFFFSTLAANKKKRTQIWLDRVIPHTPVAQIKLLQFSQQINKTCLAENKLTAFRLRQIRCYKVWRKEPNASTSFSLPPVHIAERIKRERNNHNFAVVVHALF